MGEARTAQTSTGKDAHSRFGDAHSRPDHARGEGVNRHESIMRTMVRPNSISAITTLERHSEEPTDCILNSLCVSRRMVDAFEVSSEAHRAAPDEPPFESD